MPLDTRRLARIARIDPIDMPALLKLKIQAEISLASRGYRLILCNKINCAMRNSRCRSTQPLQQNQDQHKKGERTRTYNDLSHLLLDPQRYFSITFNPKLRQSPPKPLVQVGAK